MAHRLRTMLLAAFACLTLLATGCAGADGATPGGGPRIAAMFSGPTTDGDYNALGLEALEAAKDEGAEIAYSEAVAVPDIERVMREYISDGYNILWTHGSQFMQASVKLAKEYPELTFITESDGKPKEQLDNLWYFDRAFHIPFYTIGVMASELSQTRHMGYIGGLSLPFSYSEVHAIAQAVSDRGSDLKINAVWTGDFNDPQKAQQITSQMIAQGADVIVGSLNLGSIGTMQATKDEPPGEVWVTVKYTDKSQYAPKHYAASVIYDFTGPLVDLLGKIEDGTRGGYVQMGFDNGVSIDLADDLPSNVKDAVDEAIEQIKSGAITVALNFQKYQS